MKAVIVTIPPMATNAPGATEGVIELSTPVGEFNLSNAILVDLTDEGKTMLAASEYSHLLEEKRADGKTRMQLWVFSLVFGKSMGMGNENVIKGNSFTLLREKTAEELRAEIELAKSVSGRVERIVG